MKRNNSRENVNKDDLLKDDLFQDDVKIMEKERKTDQDDESSGILTPEKVTLSTLTTCQESLFSRKKPLSQKQDEKWAQEWGVPEEKVFLARLNRKGCMNELLFIFCEAKGITEERFRTLFFEATENCSVKIDITPFAINPERAGEHFTQWWMTNAHPIAREAQTTLLELLQPREILSETPSEMSFSSFANQNQQWHEGNGDNFVFFRDHPAVHGKPNILIQRKQNSGNCYIHGPIVLHHYLMCRTNQDPQPSIDIRKFILSNLRVESLSKLITHVGGGSSREILKMLLEPDSAIFVASIPDEVCRNLHRYGPGLITNFNIEHKFRSEQVSYSGKFTSPVQGSHSMVCVGYRKQIIHSKETIFFLMQNWWENKQFVECDSDYLEESCASVWFTRKQHVTLPAFSSTTMAEYAEAEQLDGDDYALEEWRK